MLIDSLTEALPQLQERLATFAPVNFLDPLWLMLERLLLAHAPSGGARLAGGIGDEIARIADELELQERLIPRLGADKLAPDVVVVAHMDRPSFRVRSLDDGALFPICANRFPEGEYRVGAKAVRFEQGRLIVGAEGVLVSHRDAHLATVHFETKRGRLAWHDTILMEVHPALDHERVIGTGLDNCLGVLSALLTAAVLHDFENTLVEHNRRCLFVFTDLEEGPPESFFGHGAARLTYEVPPPTVGCVIVDAHTAGLGLVPQPGNGASHGTVSSWGRGTVVPPNYHALAVDLAAELNELRPGTVQLNTGYLSRSDDMILGRWTHVLGMIGPPMTDPHTGQEMAMLSDVQDTVWWLSHFLPAVMNLAPALAPLYALDT